MDAIERFIAAAKEFVDHVGIPVGDEVVPIKVVVLLATGVFLTALPGNDAAPSQRGSLRRAELGEQ